MRTLAVIIGRGCNISCSYCFNITHETVVGRGRQSGMLSEATTISAIARIIFERNYRRVVLTGGEPLLYKHVEHWIRAVKDYPIECVIVTNLTYLRPEMLKLIADNGHVNLHVSMGGFTAATHNAQRSHFEQTMLNLEKLCSVGAKLALSFVLDRENFDELPLLETWAMSRGLSVHLSPESSERGSLQGVSQPEWDRLIDQLRTPGLHYEVNITKGFFGGDLRVKHCRMRTDKHVLNDNGDLYGCFFRTDVSFGNVLIDDVSVVFDRALSYGIVSAECFGAHCIGILNH